MTCLELQVLHKLNKQEKKMNTNKMKYCFLLMVTGCLLLVYPLMAA